MRKRSVIIYWVLMLIPAVAVTLAASRLLMHEQERITRLAQTSRHERARTIAEGLQLTVDAVEAELQKTLYEIPADRLERTLLIWETSNPLIRNVFIWSDSDGLQYPLPGMASTAEERRFVERFDGLFSGRIPWASSGTADIPGHADGSALTAERRSDRQTAGQPADKEMVLKERKQSSRQALLEMARVSEPAPAEERADTVEPEKAGGWIPWFVENRLYILGWVRFGEKAPVYGVELELMTLLSRLITDFPAKEAEGVVYALKDDSGRILHQVGSAEISRKTVPESVVSLAPQLPHWEVAVYNMGETPSPLAGRGFMLLSGLLLVIFMAAVMFGGGMLTWQAHRNQKDALAKTSFVSNVSHELKTPLTSIRMYAELMFSGRVADPGKQHHYLQVIVSETRRLTRLVNNVLDFSRLEQGRKKYNPEPIDLTGYMRDVISSQALPVKEAGMNLETVLPDKAIMVQADRDALDQVMVNLIDNAVKYATGGKKLKISLDTDGNRAVIQVADRGPGVPEAHRERIFEQFHRVDDSLTARQQGSGLGLSIARRILRDLGGDLGYRPEKGGGSCFVASLPCFTDKDHEG